MAANKQKKVTEFQLEDSSADLFDLSTTAPLSKTKRFTRKIQLEAQDADIVKYVRVPVVKDETKMELWIAEDSEEFSSLSLSSPSPLDSATHSWEFCRITSLNEVEPDHSVWGDDFVPPKTKRRT